MHTGPVVAIHVANVLAMQAEAVEMAPAPPWITSKGRSNIGVPHPEAGVPSAQTVPGQAAAKVLETENKLY